MSFLDTPLIDVLLIVLALRFIFPDLFGVRRNKKQPPFNASDTQKSSVRQEPPSPQKQHPDSEGEYIDYEEVK